MAMKQKNKASDTVPSSSMADIAFLLIIFFMVTTVFSAQKGIDFALPKEEQETGDPTEAVHIVVQPSGRLLVDNAPMNMDEIQGYILPKLQVNANKFVILQTDDEAAYGDMIDVLDELKQANVRNIALPTKEEIASWGNY
ncbi:MAG: biopolymer transporter ExbD [Candidatus Schekmanbacteria bacterium]|nr:biopolymer transporter ExbD [Candidatus Schekmanbacteria bacterium]